MLKIEQTSTNQTYTLDSVHGTVSIDLTVSAPSGAVVLSGGWSSVDTTSGENFTHNVYINAPTSDKTGWELKSFASGTPNDEIQVIVYATYVQLD